VGQDGTALRADLLTAERAVWRALAAGDAAGDEALLDDAFLGVYPTGFAGKAGHSGQLASGPTVTAFDLTDARVLDLGHDLARLAYRADFTRTGRDGVETMYMSSLWRREGRGWRNLFSQDTPADAEAAA
jgi:hypothetical protein